MARTKAPSKKTCTASKKVSPNPITARKVKTEKPQKQIFKGLTMSSVGQLMHTRGGVSLEEISRWIRYHGGTYEKEVTDDTTHLICSIEEYKKGGAQVRKAWKLGTEKCQIVVFDWIEDCLQGKTKRRLREKPYTLDRTIMNLKKMNADKLREHRKKFEDGVRISKELSNSNLHHIYYDTDAFEYKVMLSRVRLDGKTLIEKYTLYLFESHNKAPPIYMFGAKLSRTCRPISYYRCDCRPMDFATAFSCFKKFFKDRTGIDWDDRLERIIPKKIENGKEIPFAFFKYLPPIQGRPVGLLPYGYVRPEDRPMEQRPMEDVGYDTDSEVGDDDQDNDLQGSSDECGSDTSDSGSHSHSDSSANSTTSGAESEGVISLSSDDLGSVFSSASTPSFLKDTPSAAGSPDGAEGALQKAPISISSDEDEAWRDTCY
ncbi:hypothetical protein BKA65DRAFT_402145 [Rhexocercosporidium sp. MPI-PUGE-AT-0058]|nr:hypothetical protein BKA65DRAFT_402145 [Rhexocercosporidium sp. MPI-PUGE-AT-0058]